VVPFGWRIVINALALWLVDALMTSVWIEKDSDGIIASIAIYLVLGLVLAVINTIVKPIAHFIAFPLYILTLGLFVLVTNALMLELVSWLSQKMGIGLHVDSFGAAIWAALILAILTALISIPFKRRVDPGQSQY